MGSSMINVGCCGFPVRKELYYEKLRVVEIQQTFYQLPRVATGERWRAEAPPQFEFAMKAWQLITHDPSSPTYQKLREVIPPNQKMNYGAFKGTEEVERAWLRTAAFARTIGANKVIFQTPAKFDPSTTHIKDLKDFFKGSRRDGLIFIWEPRGAWDPEAVEGLCKELGVVPSMDPFQAPLGEGNLFYVRLHGKTGNRDTYSDIELKALMKKASSYPEAYVMFNNTSMFDEACRLARLTGTVDSRKKAEGVAENSGGKKNDQP